MQRSLLAAAAALLLSIGGCGAGRYGHARTYQPWGDEAQYLNRAVDLSYEEVRRFPERHASELIGWFGIVREIEALDQESGEARLELQLHAHQDRHLCSERSPDSCRVTVSDRGLGPFTVLLHVRPEDLRSGPERLWTGSLLKVYGHVMDGGTDESGPIIQVDWYRHWPHGHYVTTAARGAMRR